MLTGKMSGLRIAILLTTKAVAMKDKGKNGGKRSRFIPIPLRTPKEKKGLMARNQCFTCKEKEHRFYQCPQPKSQVKQGSEDDVKAKKGFKSKKSMSSTDLIPHMPKEHRVDEALDLCRAWVNVRD